MFLRVTEQNQCTVSTRQLVHGLCNKGHYAIVGGSSMHWNSPCACDPELVRGCRVVAAAPAHNTSSMTVIYMNVVCTYDHVFHYTWSSLPLNELSPEVVLETL